MFTETEARDLLRQAADTIEIGPADPLRQPTGRHRVELAVAAVALIATGLGIAGLSRHDSTPIGPTPGGQVRVPSVFGYDAAGAHRLVAAAGLRPVTHHVPTCGEVSGRALRTRPAAGTQLSAGSSVTLLVADSEGLPCPGPVPPFADREQPWRLVDLATGSGPLPTFASLVTLEVDNDIAVTVPGAEANDPSRWPRCTPGPRCPGSALDAITSQLAQSNSLSMFLTVREVSASSITFFMDYPKDGTFPPPWTIEESFDTDGAVTDVHLTTNPGFPTNQVTGPDPDGIGHRFVDFARGESDSLPVDTPVGLYLGHQRVATIGDGDSSVRATWRVCRQYAGRTCPFSALDTLASYDGPLRLADHLTAPSPCLATLSPDPPTHTGGSHVAEILPGGTTTCLDGFAVDVYYNDVGQIVAVDLVVAEP
jgi:hypothetical protein